MLQKCVTAMAGAWTVLLLLSGCAAKTPSIQVSDQQELLQWQAPLYRDAIGVGNIWSYRQQQWIEIDPLLDDLVEADYLLLGEKHDNPDHHRIEWFLLSALRDKGRLGGLTMEMLHQEQQQKVDEAYQIPELTLAKLEGQLQWSEVKGWEWEYYGPQMLLAVEADIPLRAGNFDRNEVRSIYKQQAPFPELLNRAQQQKVQAELEQQINLSHCGQAHGDHLQAMVRVQQNRDLVMAEEMMTQANVSVLVAGAFHVRRDVGVPVYLLKERPDDRLLSLGMIEIDEPQDAGVGAAVAEFKGVYDYLWFTPNVVRPDYCANWKARTRKGG